MTGFDMGGADASISAGCIVPAESPEEAAAIAVAWLEEEDTERGDGGASPYEHVFLTEWTDRACYRVAGREITMELAPWQCCGGPNDEGQHFGGCPTRRQDPDDD